MGLGVVFGHCHRDLRYAVRRLRQSPGFTLATAFTLALGIGANTAMFSVVDSILLRSLPYKDPERLVVVWQKPAKDQHSVTSEANYLDWRNQNRVFSQIAAFATTGFNLSGAGQAERVDGVSTTWDVFPMLGAAPVVGRGFQPYDDRPGAPRTAILSYGLWQRKFGGDPAVLGRTITVNGEPATIVGVMPRNFRFFYSPDMFMPLALDEAKASREIGYLAAIGRLKPGITFGQAEAEMTRIAGNLEAAYPKENQGVGVYLETVRHAIMHTGQIESVWVLCGAVWFVLLIACVNVANLMLAKVAVRQRELAVRASLGAGRGRLVAQLLAESVLLSLGGGLMGVALAAWLLKLVPNLVADFARAGVAEIGLDWRVLAFTLALSIVTGLFFGVFPAWRASRPDLQSMLKQAGRGSSGSLSQAKFRGALVMIQMALSLVLLASAGVMLRSLAALENANPGFRQDHLLTMRLAMANTHYAPANLRVFYRRVLESAASLPSVEGAGLSLGLPLEGAQVGMPFQVASHTATPNLLTFAPFEMVSPDFYRIMAIPLRKGRYFSERDDENAPRVAIVNEAFVRRYLPDEQPLGKKLLMQSLISGSKDVGPATAWEIVGVVADVRYKGLNEKRAVPEIYVPLMQSPWPGAALILRTASEPTSVTQAARIVLARVDPEVPLTSVKTMDQITADSLSQPRLRAWLIGTFAAVALIMAALGIYALISYSVAQATHDLGVRVALGANRGQIVRLVLTRSLLLAAGGLLPGLAGALALTRLLASFSLLFHVEPNDPWTFVAVSLLLLVVALVAGLIPAVRASRIDPAVSLRAE
jgi:putative ABC transport system permease protein